MMRGVNLTVRSLPAFLHKIFARKRTANPRGPCTILGILSSITTVRKPHVKTGKKKTACLCIRVHFSRLISKIPSPFIIEKCTIHIFIVRTGNCLLLTIQHSLVLLKHWGRALDSGLSHPIHRGHTRAANFYWQYAIQPT